MSGDKLVVELLDVDNYATWRRRMKSLLVIKNLWGAVTGDTVDEQSDAKALAQIMLHVMDHHLSMVEGCGSSKEAWEKLEDVYQGKSGARKRQLRKELTLLTMGAAEPVSKYVARAKEIQNQLRAAGHEVGDQEVAWAVLAGLPKHFETIVTVLETSSESDLKLDEMLPKLMAFEQRKESTDIAPMTRGEAALAAKQRPRYPETRTCYKCGERGHIAKNCRKKSVAGYVSAIAL